MFVYIFLFLLVAFCSLIISFAEKVTSKISEVVLFIILVIFTGIRKNVGTDYEAYHTIFYCIANYNISPFPVEPGFYFLNYIIAHAGLPFYWVTIVASFISFLFLFKSINYFSPAPGYKWLAYLVFISIGVYFVYFMSGIRQGIAIAIFLYAIRYIEEKKFIKYFSLIILGFLFHASVLVTLPFYWISSKPINRFVVVVGVIISCAFAYTGITSKVFQLIVSQISGHYAAYGEAFSGTANVGTGLGVILRIFLGLMLVVTSKFWIQESKEGYLYNLLAVGLILYSFFLGVDILLRISDYFTNVLILIIPISCKAFRLKSKFIYILCLVVILLGLYYSAINFKGMNLIPYKI